LAEKRHVMQVLLGPRQVGKTTLITQVLEDKSLSYVFGSADDQQLHGRAWIEQQWELARTKKAQVLVLDEIQKIEGWSEIVKKHWDRDSRQKAGLHVVLLGSSTGLIQKGMTESLAGRFEIIRVPHWSFSEMKEAFGFTLDEFVFFGGYPGMAFAKDDFTRWKRAVQDSLIETTVAKDILLHARIEKPALLRRLFQLVCEYSSQILSYQKMVGQLQDVGNTTTLAHYLDLLQGAGLCVGLQKYEGRKHRLRSSIPKLQVYNTALISSQGSLQLEQVKNDPELWGRRVESAVGAHLLNCALEHGWELFYWRDGNFEVDFVLEAEGKAIAIEVKSGRRRTSLSGLERIRKKHKNLQPLLVGSGGIPLQDFLAKSPLAWVAR
jgi:predicted AAA+ superfamily ATPase